MVDNVTLNSGSGGDTIRADDDGTAKWQYVKLAYGADNTQTIVTSTATNPLPVALSDTDNAVLDTIETNTDYGAVTGGGVEASALRVTLANDSTGVLSVDDNGGSLTVDGTVTANAGTGTFTVDNAGTFAVQAAIDELPAAAAATDNFANPTTTNILSMGMVWDGATWDRAPGNATDGLLVNLGANNDISGTVTANAGTGTFTVDGSGVTQPVSGTVTANLSATDNAVLDQIEVNTSYGDNTGGGTEAGALRVTLANDSTGVLSIDDNGSTISIDDGGGAITVDGTVTANLSATDNTVLDNIDTNTTRGSSHYRNIDANAEASIKGSAGTLHWIHAINLTASIAYLHLYDATTANVTPGTTTPDYTFPIPTQGDTNGAGFNLRMDQEFANAITLVVTTTTDGSAGDPGTNGVMVNAGYS